jgi:uncharacterized LabA/DUF88 family protein
VGTNYCGNVSTPEQARLAVLIDSDNISASRISALLAEIATYGVASVRRMYGDWTTENLKSWKDAANEHAIQPVQQFAYTTGRNATDSAMIIDAMDLLYTERFDGFCLVSSDSDFTRLASRLRESGVTVYGFGERKTPKPFVTACDRFIYLEVLGGSVEDEPKTPTKKRPTVSQLRGDTGLISLLRNGVNAASDEDGWAYLSNVGLHVRNQKPDFDPRNWGFTTLSDLMTTTGLFELAKTKTRIRVRNK